MGKLIDADALIHGLRVDPAECPGCPEPEFLDDIISLLEEAPAVDAVLVVRTGTWKAVTDDGENYKRICTCCGKEAPFDELEGVYLIYPHCPWCGADMRKDGDQ